MAVHDKELTVPGTVEVAGRQVKRYYIDQPDRRLEPEVVEAAHAYQDAGQCAGVKARAGGPPRSSVL
ncbi:hypothetical protein ACNAW0_28400 [Micromonospora sp. SL1-18]|uniref:hypothetical protein n=1 Tax=Micromonospora sp. SL1-18 TaxID=3399128 RepID=UPI003A4DE061